MIDVYINSDTEEVFNVTQNDTPYDLDVQNITKVIVYVCEGTAKLVSESDRFISSDNGDISWVVDELTIILGHLNVPSGRYTGKVKFYNATTPKGFVVHTLDLMVNC